MSSKSAPAERFSLRRWSQRKLEAARAQAPAPSHTPSSVAAVSADQATVPTAHNALAPADRASSTLSAEAPLPAIESLTIDSDFAPFFKPQVDESLKRAALKQLFRDPRFNVMDGLDTYIDDYSLPDPIPSAMLEDLMQRRGFFPPPASETDVRESAVDEPAREPAPPAEAIAPPPPVVAAAPVASNSPDAPVAPSEAAISGATRAAPETDAAAKSAKP
jgi:hypothetical protein